jgi:hypothetical protein
VTRFPPITEPGFEKVEMIGLMFFGIVVPAVPALLCRLKDGDAC